MNQKILYQKSLSNTPNEVINKLNILDDIENQNNNEIVKTKKDNIFILNKNSIKK